MKNLLLESIVRQRILEARPQINNSLKEIASGNPLACERDDQRLEDRMAVKLHVPASEARRVSQTIRLQSTSRRARAGVSKPTGPEAIWGDTIDFVDVAFLERGLLASRSVARVVFLNGQAQGSGFMVSDRLFITNHHVIGTEGDASQFKLEFNFERDAAGQLRVPTSFSLNPSLFFATDPISGLDFTLIAVGDKLSGPGQLSDFGWNALSSAGNKHALGEFANIIQHPAGRLKEVVLRENRLVSRLPFALHYIADTEPGSSGSPVFNTDWEVIALHHWGGPWREQPADNVPGSREINEGIRISAILEHLQSVSGNRSTSQQALLNRILDSESRGPAIPTTVTSPVDSQPACRIDDDGRVTWQIPIEVSVRMPLLDRSRPVPRVEPPVDNGPRPVVTPVSVRSEANIRPSRDYSHRSGYRSDFIPGFDVPLPVLTADQQAMAAINKRPITGDDPHVLRYHHFSIAMNSRRRLAFYAACNIDGSKAKHVDRKTGTVSVLLPGDPHLEALRSEGAEASEQWYEDDRIEPEDFAGRDVYETQIVPGFPIPSSRGRILRMFQRGHLVRRMDPAWGNVRMARLADADTFHWTNCAPQVGFFNMGQADPATPQSGGGQLWRAAENYVLRNAVAEGQRVSCITGPVFGSEDRRFRSIRVPMQFWKVIIWAEAESGALRSLALLLDQSPVIEVWPESLDSGGESLGVEAFGDPDQLAKVEDFLSTVKEIERLTDLDFGHLVRAADLRNGEGPSPLQTDAGIPLSPKKPKPRGKRR